MLDRRGVRRSLRGRHDDPLLLLVNLFDCSVVLALGLALAAGRGRASPADAVPADRTVVEHYRVAPGTNRGEGTRLGVAYRLAGGDVVFVPEDGPASASGSPR